MEKFKGNGDTGQGAPNKDFGGSEKGAKMKRLTEGRQTVSRWKRCSEEQGAGPKTGGHRLRSQDKGEDGVPKEYQGNGLSAL